MPFQAQRPSLNSNCCLGVYPHPIFSLLNSLQQKVSIIYPSTHASANLPLSFRVTNSVRQRGAAPLAMSDIQLVTTYNEMPTRCNRGFYCRSYCLLNLYRATLCPSSGAQEYYTVVAACGISCCGFQVAGMVWS